MEITMSWPAAASPMSSSEMCQTASSVSAAGTEEYRCLWRYVVSATVPLSAKGVISSQFINHIESTLGWFDGKAARLNHTYLISVWSSTLLCFSLQEYWYQPQPHQSNGQDKTAPKNGVHFVSQEQMRVETLFGLRFVQGCEKFWIEELVPCYRALSKTKHKFATSF